ncbi:MAG: hypothetical protein ACOY7U_00655 [Acidobacteriota bacterium]|jgi:hypothetical protein|uniref:Uncharacterized protein n=1 Tax=Thermoanaerobaculum aquaticum TaxID=1312852 RepID=A0A7C2NTT1_9BACT|nr:MAG: hypothetical protein KatS3mg007_0271 [Thermoanaerobaculum sp.]GBC79340.1 hypothetical protein HRbin09_00556 [bacterium HR09]
MARLIAGAALAVLLLPALAWSQGKALATAETNWKATAELYECKRKQGVLTVKVRFKATADTKIELPHNQTYVVDVGAGKKYEILRDSDKNAIATRSEHYGDRALVYLKSGETFTAWWKFPAPPASTTQVTVSLPGCEPFEDVPISDVR